MRLVPYDATKLKVYKLCKNQKLIQEFLDSEQTCVKIEDFPHKNASVCRSVLGISIKRMGVNNVIAVLRKGCVYLIRTDKVDVL